MAVTNQGGEGTLHTGGRTSTSAPFIRFALRHSDWDWLFVGLTLLQALLLWTVPSVPLLALGLWWNANTAAHNFIHAPFFRSRGANRLFALVLSVVLTVPQTLWRERHLAHHAGRAYQLRLSFASGMEIAAIILFWGLVGWGRPGFFFTLYFPGVFLGLLLCHCQGVFEHRGGTTSHYGRLYNLLFFNDGFHLEHHARPGRHWKSLPRHRVAGKTSRWPAILRWLDLFNLDFLEGVVLRAPWLQRFIFKTHLRAFEKLLPQLPEIKTATVVGGGLFPRSALVLRRLLPSAEITLLDRKAEHLKIAARFVSNVRFVRETFHGRANPGVDLLVIPLAYCGDRQAVYAHPPARAVLVHDWFWRPRGRSVMISFALLKRLNLIVP